MGGLKKDKTMGKLRKLRAKNNGFIVWLRNGDTSLCEDTVFVDATRENLIQAIWYNTNVKTTLGLLQNTNIEDLLWEARRLNLIL